MWLKTAAMPRLRSLGVKVKEGWGLQSLSATQVAGTFHHGATLAPGRGLREAEGGDWAFADRLQAAAPRKQGAS